MRESFGEEFYVVRGLERTNPNVHIPSTNTLALLFTDDSYVPGRKILHTCRSYAEGPANLAFAPDVPTLSQHKPPQPSRFNWLLMSGLVNLFCLGVFIKAEYVSLGPSPSGLLITRPIPNAFVPQEVVVEGKVANAETVWLAVRSKANGLVWIQPPITVQDNGNWVGVIYIGGLSKSDEGYTNQLRAFVNPSVKLTSGDMLDTWPEAELSSSIVEVVRAVSHN